MKIFLSIYYYDFFFFFFLKWRSKYENDDRQIAALIGMERFRMFMHI